MASLFIGGKEVKEMFIGGKEVAKITLDGKTFEFDSNPYIRREQSITEFWGTPTQVEGKYRFTNAFVAMEDDTYADHEEGDYKAGGYEYRTKISKAYSDHKYYSNEFLRISGGKKFIEDGGHFLLSTVGLGFIPVHVTSRQTGRWIFNDTIKKTNSSLDQTNLKISTHKGDVNKEYSKAECGYIKWEDEGDDIVISLQVWVQDSGGEQGLAGYFNDVPTSKIIIEGVK